MTLLDRLEGLKLLVVTGKGGVGKSTLAAVAGRLLARRGRRVLLLEIDRRESLYQLLGVSPSGGTYEQAEERLHLQNLSPRAVMDEVVRERIRVGLIYRRLLTSPIYGHFVEAAPGLREMAALGHAMRVVRGMAGPAAPRVDLVVLDAPATGHGVSLLTAPGLVSDVIREGPFGRMAAELAAYVSDQKTCGILLVTSAEEMPVQEAIESIATLSERMERSPDLVIVNGMYPPADGGADAGYPDREEPDEALRLWAKRRLVNEREKARLLRAWSGPCLELPLLPLSRGAELVAALGIELARGLEAATA